MIRLLKQLFGRGDAATTDARRIYTQLMAQSRRAQFFGQERFADSYDGRIDVLTLHIAAILSNLNRFGQNGERLGQALFDEMKDDFEIALREEALSDASVKKRIQPMISLFYDRVKKYAEALHEEDQRAALGRVFSHEGEGRRARFLLHGDAEKLAPFLDAAPRTRERSEVFHTEKTVAMEDKPSQALRQGKGSSMWNAVASVKGGQAGVVVSAGNTGAFMAMSKLQLRAKPGVQRPALAASWPNMTGGMTVVLDVGANVECDAAQLTEFAVLGEAYYRAIYGEASPSVGLLNVGTEDGKGNAVVFFWA